MIVGDTAGDITLLESAGDFHNLNLDLRLIKDIAAFI
jgi:hypothetical protein